MARYLVNLITIVCIKYMTEYMMVYLDIEIKKNYIKVFAQNVIIRFVDKLALLEYNIH